jgi:hypothetical protein
MKTLLSVSVVFVLALTGTAQAQGGSYFEEFERMCWAGCISYDRTDPSIRLTFLPRALPLLPLVPQLHRAYEIQPSNRHLPWEPAQRLNAQEKPPAVTKADPALVAQIQQARQAVEDARAAVLESAEYKAYIGSKAYKAFQSVERLLKSLEAQASKPPDTK